MERKMSVLEETLNDIREIETPLREKGVEFDQKVIELIKKLNDEYLEDVDRHREAFYHLARRGYLDTNITFSVGDLTIESMPFEDIINDSGDDCIIVTKNIDEKGIKTELSMIFHEYAYDGDFNIEFDQHASMQHLEKYVKLQKAKIILMESFIENYAQFEAEMKNLIKEGLENGRKKVQNTLNDLTL